jgi:hypothetical protein
MEFGSVVERGTGVGRAGAQAKISVRVINQKDNLVRYVIIDVLVQLSGIYTGYASCEIS